MTFDWTQVILALMTLLGTIITCVLVPLIKSKVSESQFAQLKNLVKIAVSAAEQIYNTTGMGQTKKQYVVAWLKGHGVDFDEAALDAAIESAVYELKTK